MGLFKTATDLVLKPLLRRAGTAIATALVLAGDRVCDIAEQTCGLVTQPGAVLVAEYVVAVGLVGLDLLGSFLEKQAVKRQVLSAVAPRVRAL